MPGFMLVRFRVPDICSVSDGRAAFFKAAAPLWENPRAIAAQFPQNAAEPRWEASIKSRFAGPISLD
jgi:hypothetical protein